MSPISSKAALVWAGLLVGTVLLGQASAQTDFGAASTGVPPLSSSGSASAPGGPGSAAATVAATNSMEVLENSRKLGTGDQVSFRVVEDRDPPIPLVITDSGELEVPYIGRVRAAGRTCKELAFSVKKALEVDYYYRATVIIGLDRRSTESKGRVYVSGEVVNKGPQEIPANETFTASNAITRAGGPARFANKRKIRIIRKRPDGGTDILIFDYVRVIEQGRVEEDIALQPGDIINVPANAISL